VSLDSLRSVEAVIGPVGVPELLLIGLVVLVIFGPKRLPDLGRSLGTGMREFKDSITGKSGAEDDDDEEAGAIGPPTPSNPTGERDEAATRRGSS
jgi:sec-independent protein translocase protein TatA